MNNLRRKAAGSVGLSLQDTFVAFAICMMIYGKRRKSFIVINAVYVELEVERTFSIVILADAVWLFLQKIPILACGTY
jgi:hypothetical protein